MEEKVKPLQFLQFCNDSLFVTYSDQSSVSLSPCGNQFHHDSSLCKSPHYNSVGVNRVQHMTEFATSYYKSQVREALEFRNMFANRPFISSLLLTSDKAKSYNGILVSEVHWPSKYTSAEVECTKNGRYRVRSLDGSAELVLAANRREFRVHFTIYAQTCSSSPIQQSVRVTQHFCVSACPPLWRYPLSLLLKNIDSQAFNSATSCSAALDSLTEQDDLFKSVLTATTTLPKSLPLRCKSQHMHKFEAISPPFRNVSSSDSDNPFNMPSVISDREWWLGLTALQGPLKVMCAEGILYRLLYPVNFFLSCQSQSKRLHNESVNRDNTGSVEIFPGDGSVLVSNSLTGDYFTHYLPSKNGEIVERVYNSMKPPPTYPHKMPYQLTELLSTARILCRHIREVTVSRQQIASVSALLMRTTCWWSKKDPQGLFGDHRQEEDEENVNDEENGEDDLVISSARLLEHQIAEGVGKFYAYDNGRVHIVFRDRVTVDMQTSLVKTNRPFVPCPDLPPDGSCRLLTREGIYEIVSIETPPPYYEKYINSGLEWIAWVNSTPQEREQFYNQKSESISCEDELMKIKSFNYRDQYLNSNSKTETPHYQSNNYSSTFPANQNNSRRTYHNNNVQQSPPDLYSDVSHALERSSQFLRRLDSLSLRPDNYWDKDEACNEEEESDRGDSDHSPEENWENEEHEVDDC